jgi:hypothetical protein
MTDITPSQNQTVAGISKSILFIENNHGRGHKIRHFFFFRMFLKFDLILSACGQELPKTFLMQKHYKILKAGQIQTRIL